MFKPRIIFIEIYCNELPIFDQDLHNTVIPEDTPVGSVIGNLVGKAAEGTVLRYGIEGTDLFSVDPHSGEVKLVKPLDREVN